MEHSLPMKMHHTMLWLVLLIIPRVSSQQASTLLYHQNVYPGCKSSSDQPDLSYQTCSTTIDQLNSTSGVSVNTFLGRDRLESCFVNGSEIAISPVADLTLVFYKDVAPKENFCQNGKCSCKVAISGPPGTFFKIIVYSIAQFSEFEVEIKDGSRKHQYKFTERKTTLTTIHNELEFEISYNHDFSIFFQFNFRAVPICERQLTVNCTDNTTGLIGTPGWSEGEKYLNDMNSCVTLHVPDSHVIMVSLISIDLELARNKIDCYDYLILFRSENCTGDLQEADRICQAHDLVPALLKGADAVSFLFKSNSRIVRTGFRLLYTFHPISEEPLRLPNGTWDCTVPYYESFKKHFMCVAGSYCTDRRDKVTCPQQVICGSNLVEFGGSCYRMFKPFERTTWNKASETCTNYGGSLAILNTRFKLQMAANFSIKTKVFSVFVGLRIASSVTLKEMYQTSWLWSDNTLAIFLPLEFSVVEAPYCAFISLEKTSVTMITCDEALEAGFLCETDFTPDHAINNTDIAMETRVALDTRKMARCRHNHTTHIFLACDVKTNCSVVSQEEIVACSREFSPPVPFFTCRNQMERVPYTLVCDFRSDCCDGSDEDFCDFPACERRTEYQCGDGKQCIHHELVCNKRSNCVDGSDEFKCRDGLSRREFHNNMLEPPARVDFTGDGSFKVTQLSNTTCTETHFQCPGDGYCLPVYVRCNGVNDCPGTEDEMNCDHYTCPGFYRCRQSPICLHSEHLCDGIFQCPQHDDEWMCNFTCPDNCHCYGHAFICTGFFSADGYPELRYVDASSTAMKLEHFLNNTKLIHLNLRNCGITTIGSIIFPDLQVLDLSYNGISKLDSRIFQLKNLLSLSLAYNHGMDVRPFLQSASQFSNIINVNFSGIVIPDWDDALLRKFPNVRYFNISQSGLEKLTKTGFQFVKSLRVLDLRGCPMNTFYEGVFDGLDQLQLIYADKFKLCCPAVLPADMNPTSCNAPKSEISSCDALLRADVFRAFLAIYAILALLGNAGSFVYRIGFEKSAAKLGYEVFVTHLSVADFLMGVYLAIIGIADRVFLGNYLWNDIIWTHSVACKLAGFLSLVSSEVSAFLISLITLERLLVIGLPHRNLRFSRLSAHAASMATWLIGLVLALIPLLPFAKSWEFYSQSGICVPLPITRQEFGGKDYAFGVMIIINFILFVFIAVGQLLIYWSIRVNTAGVTDNARKSRDTAIARRLLAVVMTDFLCWFPIGLLGMMARSGVPISGDVNVAIAIFVLPFNSALNPFLYTLNVVMERRQKQAEAGKSRDGRGTMSTMNRSKVFDVISESKKEKKSFSKEEAFQLFAKFLEDGLLTPEEIRRQVWDIYEG